MGRPTNIIVLTESYQQIALEFYDHILQLGYNVHSSRTMWGYLKEFLQYAERNIGTDVKQISIQHLIDYHSYLQQRRNKQDGTTLHAKSIHHHFRTLRHFFSMLQSLEQIEVNPMHTFKNAYPKGNDATRSALTQEEIKVLYSACENYQEKALLALGYGCGLRVSELVGCNIEDINMREAILIVAKGKGNKGRVVPLSKTVVKDLSDYLFKDRLHQETREDKAFMLNSRGRRMQKGTYNKVLRNLINQTASPSIIGKQISMHHLRHSIATHLIEQGVPLEGVRAFLGHSQLESTEVYTHISQSQLKALMK